MRIERIRIDAFGRLADFDTGERPLPSLVVVLGPNEAGKSTVFQFLTTLLYGFRPATRDGNPLVPWGADEAGGSARLRLSDGRVAEVSRKLRSQPTGQLELDGGTSDLRNREVPWVQHIPRAVFRQVFAVTLAELATLDDDTWGRIQDRVVGSMGTSDLKPVRAVAEALEQEAGELWRPNRRGHQRIRHLRDEIRALRSRRAEALERDRELRALVKERARVHEELRACREQREKDTLVLHRITSLAPVRAQLLRIEALRREAGIEADLADLPPDPPARFQELEAEQRRFEERLGALRAERAAPDAARAARTPEVAQVVEHAEAIVRLGASASSASADRARAEELAAELAALEDTLRRTASDVLDVPWDDAPHEVVLALSSAELRSAAEGAARARAARDEASAALAAADGSVGAAPAPAGRWGFPAGGAAVLVVGLVLLAWGVSTSLDIGRAAGAGLALLGALMLGGGTHAAVRDRRREEVERARAREAREDARARREDEARDARAVLERLVAGAPLRPGLLDAPDAGWTATLDRLRDLAGEAGRKRHTLETTRARMDAADRSALALAATLGAESDPAAPAPLVAGVLADLLRRAEQVESAAALADRELTRLDRDRESVCGRLEVVRRELDGLRRVSGRFSEASVHEGLRRAAGKLRAREHAQRLEEELERTQPDLGELRRRIADAERSGAVWSLADHELAARRARLQELTDRVESLIARAKDLDGRIEHGARQETADAVDSEILAFEEEVRDVIRERDRKWVLARLLREADRRFREEHQPDLVRRASGYLAHLTDGRYDRLLIEEAGAGDLFHIAGPGTAGPIPLRPPVSTGTLEQAYLSLRLAMVDHLDHGVAALPLFVDEIFVNWDDARRARGLEMLGRISATRQLFVFTCHPGIAEELEGTGAGVVRLER